MDEATIRDQFATGSAGSLTFAAGATQLECSVSGGAAHISHLHVAADARRGGTASTLFNVLLSELRNRDVARVSANVKVTNFDPDEHDIDEYGLDGEVWDDPTVSFLDHYGFTGFDIRPYGDGEDAVLVVTAHRML